MYAELSAVLGHDPEDTEDGGDSLSPDELASDPGWLVDAVRDALEDGDEETTADLKELAAKGA